MHDKSNTLKKEQVIFSLFPLKIMIFMLSAGPLYGIYLSYTQNKSLLGLYADQELLLKFSIYVFMVGIFLLTIKSNVTINYISHNNIKTISHRVLLLAILCFISIFLFAGIHTLSGTLGRGDVRINAGILGPFYALSLKYLLPLISLLTSVILYQQKQFKTSKYVYIILLACGFMSGGKAITIFILLSTTCYFWPKFSFLKKTISILIAITIIISSHMFFSKRDITISDSINYNITRATQISAYGALAAWDFSKENDIEKLPTIMRSIFGDHLVKLLFETDNTNLMYWNISKLITYTYYPDWARAREGSTNLTLTIFSDFILYFESFWFFGLVIFLLFLYVLIHLMKTAFSGGNIILGSILFLYINMTILSIINSGGFFRALSIPNLVYYLILFIIVRFYILRAR